MIAAIRIIAVRISVSPGGTYHNREHLLAGNRFDAPVVRLKSLKALQFM